MFPTTVTCPFAFRFAFTDAACFLECTSGSEAVQHPFSCQPYSEVVRVPVLPVACKTGSDESRLRPSISGYATNALTYVEACLLFTAHAAPYFPMRRISTGRTRFRASPPSPVQSIRICDTCRAVGAGARQGVVSPTGEPRTENPVSATCATCL